MPMPVVIWYSELLENYDDSSAYEIYSGMMIQLLNFLCFLETVLLGDLSDEDSNKSYCSVCIFK